MNELPDFELPIEPVETIKKKPRKPMKEAVKAKKVPKAAKVSKIRRRKKRGLKVAPHAKKLVQTDFSIEAYNLIQMLLQVKRPIRNLVLSIVQELSK